MRREPPRGMTLLETVMYIGVISIVLPTFTIFVLHVWQQQIKFDARMRLEQTSSLVFLELSHDLIEADAIQVSTSTLGTDTSLLQLQDKDGTAMVIDTVSTSINFSGTNQTVRRLRLTRGSNTPVWLTEPEYSVSQWRVDAVRNASNVLTGLRVSFDAALINNTSKIYRDATFAGDTTFALSPSTLEQ